MKAYRKIIVFVMSVYILAFSINSLMGQSSELSLMNSKVDFVRNQINPSYIPEKDKGFIMGIPLLSEYSFSLSTPIVLSDAISTKDNKNIIYYDRILNNLAGNRIDADVSTNILQMGFNTNSGFYSIKLGVKTSASLKIDEEFANVLLDGNSKYRGQIVKGRIGALEAQAYNELSFGYATNKIFDDERLSIGANLKFLVGHIYAGIENSEFSLYTSEFGDEIRLESYQTAYMSMPKLPGTNSDGNVSWDSLDINSFIPKSPKNFGVGLDLGATYNFNKEWSLAFAIKDLGFINWENNAQIEQDLRGDKAIVYKGMNISNVFWDTENNNKSEKVENISDQLKDNFKYNDEVSDRKSYLNTKIYTIATYSPVKEFQVSTLLGASKKLSEWYTDLSLSMNWQPAKSFGTGLSISKVEGTPWNIAGGLVLGDSFQFHLTVGNFLTFNSFELYGKFGIGLRL